MGRIIRFINGLIDAIYHETVVVPTQELLYKTIQDIQEEQQTVQEPLSYKEPTLHGIVVIYQKKPKKIPIYDRNMVTRYIKQYQYDYSKKTYHRCITSHRVMTHTVK